MCVQRVYDIVRDLPRPSQLLALIRALSVPGPWDWLLVSLRTTRARTGMDHFLGPVQPLLNNFINFKFTELVGR